MKKSNVSVRKVSCRAVFALGCFVFIQLVGARDARAESPRKVAGFEVLGTLGYGATVGDVTWWDNQELAPYGVMLGFGLGYTLPFGLRIGADFNYGFGRKVEQTSSTGEVVVTDVSSTGYGGSLGYELLLPLFRLRGAVDSGFLVYRGEATRQAGAAFYIGPELALIWQYRALELGLQSKYWVTSAEHGLFQAGLIRGARL